MERGREHKQKGHPHAALSNDKNMPSGYGLASLHWREINIGKDHSLKSTFQTAYPGANESMQSVLFLAVLILFTIYTHDNG